MKCNYTLQVNIFENGLMTVLPFSINTDYDLEDNLNIELITNLIYNMLPSERTKLASLLRKAKVVPVTNSMVTKHNFISNTSLELLLQLYSQYYSMYPDIKTTENMVLIACNSMKLNGSKYYGRCILADGKPIYFINGEWGAKKLFECLDLKGKIEKFTKEGNLAKDLREVATDLGILEKHYKKPIQKILLEYLDNNTPYLKVFKNVNTIINPTRIINSVFAKLRGTYDSTLDKSDLLLSLKQANVSDYKDKYGFKITMKNLYNILSLYYEDLKPYEEVTNMSLEELLDYLHELFSLDATLYKLRVDSITGGEIKLKETKATKKSFTLKDIKDAWTAYNDSLKALGISLESLEYYLQNSPEQAKAFIKSAISNMSSTYNDIEVNIETNKKGKNIAKVTYMTLPTVKDVESAKYVVLKSPYSYLGEVYNFGYSSDYLFSPVNNDDIVDGKYHGAYVYAYYNESTGTTHYAISRSIINPNSYAATYNNLDRAKYLIDKWNSELTIGDNGLYTIKLNDGSLKRTSKLEASNLKNGLIITVLDISLPNNINRESMPIDFQELFKGNVPQFQLRFNMIDGIETLETPEKAAAFMFKFFDAIKHDNEGINKGLNLEELIEKNKGVGSLIAKEINLAHTKSYFIENLKGSIATLRLLKNNGNDVQITGKFKDGKSANAPTVSDMENAIKFVNTKFGVKINTVTLTELNEMDGVDKNAKAFILNGEIYINTSNSTLSDLYHEMAHIMLGVLKVKYPDAYTNVINQIANGRLKNAYNNLLKSAIKLYANYARLDIIEEAVANTIANNLYNKQYLVEEFKGQEFLNDFIDIFNNFPKEIESPNFGMGFSTWLSTNYKESSDLIKKNIKLTNLIHTLMKNGTVIENCE